MTTKILLRGWEDAIKALSLVCYDCNHVEIVAVRDKVEEDVFAGETGNDLTANTILLRAWKRRKPYFKTSIG
jgi:hypothetical protein